jgi:hypothetical protein
MLADPRHSRIVLLNMTRRDGAEPDASSLRYSRELSLLPVCQDVFGVPKIAVGEYERALLPQEVTLAIEHLAIDGLSLWRNPQLVERLPNSDVGVIFLCGAFLEEEVLLAALEGARSGYDIRLIWDLSLAGCEADRPIVLARLAHHGIIASTIRQTLLEWAAALGDQVVSRKIQELLS